MKKKYVYSLIVIGVLLFISIAIEIGYGIWINVSKQNSKDSTLLACFKIYYSSSPLINNTNIKPVPNDIGKEQSPLTITITNVCSVDKELQLRMNILKDNEIDISSLMLDVSGDIEKKEVLYTSLESAKIKSDGIYQSKTIGVVSLKPNETVRTNIKYWFDERKVISIDPNQVFSANFDLIDKDQTIELSFADTIIHQFPDVGAKGNPDFSSISLTNEGLYKQEENGIINYYFRGNTANNYVVFGDMIWRIVRINPDYSVRLVLQDTIGYTEYSSFSNSKDYTGLKYVYNDVLIDNNINTYLLDWYTENIINQGLDKYVYTSAFCNDSSNTIQNYQTYFNGVKRLVNNREPSLLCEKTTEDFGGELKSKIGLLSADEIVLAGGSSSLNNSNFYLYNGTEFATLTPYEYSNYHAYIFSYGETLHSSLTSTSLGVRPVISLDPTITVTGTGTFENPYKIELD